MAHNIVRRVVRDTIEAGRTAMTMTTADLDEACKALFGHTLGISEEVVRRALDPAENLKSRTVTGGPAPERMHEMIARRNTAFGEDATRISNIRKRLADADVELDTQTQKALGGAGTQAQNHMTGEKHGTR
ncbi:hypothetical protein LP421_33070 (plasmid) [Rhizobium sp. RCAM05350]|nr:hypothetical protein LP421_33070 [Rhizobium sp. RCAM05350]